MLPGVPGRLGLAEGFQAMLLTRDFCLCEFLGLFFHFYSSMCLLVTFKYVSDV